MPDPVKALVDKALKVDNRFYNTVWGEGTGGPPEEIKAIASVFLNRAKKKGYESALKGSAAYNKKSPQYKKAEKQQFNPYERMMWERNKAIIDSLIQNPQNVLPYNYFENVKAYGNPPWANQMKSYQDIGRQRFYEGANRPQQPLNQRQMQIAQRPTTQLPPWLNGGNEVSNSQGGFA